MPPEEGEGEEWDDEPRQLAGDPDGQEWAKVARLQPGEGVLHVEALELGRRRCAGEIKGGDQAIARGAEGIDDESDVAETGATQERDEGATDEAQDEGPTEHIWDAAEVGARFSDPPSGGTENDEQAEKEEGGARSVGEECADDHAPAQGAEKGVNLSGRLQSKGAYAAGHRVQSPNAGRFYPFLLE